VRALPPDRPLVAAARDRYYCLPTFDVQGGPAGQPDDAAGGAKAPVTDFPLNSDPLVCAASCSATPGCEYFVQVKPAGCYLKSRPVRGRREAQWPTATRVRGLLVRLRVRLGTGGWGSGLPLCKVRACVSDARGRAC
jgi:hypothetical protein